MSGTIRWIRNNFGGSGKLSSPKFSLKIEKNGPFIHKLLYGIHNLNYLRWVKCNFSKLFGIPNWLVNMFLIRLLSHYRFESNELFLELKTG